jgi:membrane fusion protein (multidrug efflux system)
MDMQASNTSESTADIPMVKPRKKQCAVLFSLLGLAVAAAGGGAVEYWKLIGSRYVSTDNAYTAAEVAQVASETEGSVMQVNAVDSQNVRRGDILVMIDDTDAKLALRQAQADLARAQAQVIAAISDVERTGIDLQRREALVASGSVSGDELTNAKNRASGARAALDASRAQVALARARLDKSDVDLGRTVIRAPIDGVIARRQVVELKSDLYHSKVVYHGVIEGFDGGTGAAFALIPAQNATGNWIKVVQRLPVRIRLNPEELAAHPLRVGLSMDAKVDLNSNT